MANRAGASVAPDKWDSARFLGVCVTSSGFRYNGVISSRLVVEPVETHLRVTHTVGRTGKYFDEIM